jgi:hypothetical protein
MQKCFKTQGVFLPKTEGRLMTDNLFNGLGESGLDESSEISKCKGGEGACGKINELAKTNFALYAHEKEIE